GRGQPILLLHGLPTSGELWNRVVPLIENGRQCIVVDFPGFGNSSDGKPTVFGPSEFAQQLLCLQSRLGIARWDLLAHDAGSVVAVHLAHRWPQTVRRLLLCSPPLV